MWCVCRFFSWSTWGVRACGGTVQGHRTIGSLSYQIEDVLSTWLLTIDADLDRLAEGAFVRCLLRKVTLSSSFLYCFFKARSHHVQSTVKERGVTSHLLEGRTSTYIIWNSFALIHSPPFVCLFSYWSVSVRTCGYLFHTLGEDAILLYFVVTVVPTWGIGCFFSGASILLTYPHPCRFFVLVFFFLMLPYFLALQAIRCSRFIWY